MTSHRPLGSTGLHCHALGFGCYRIMDGDPDHESALRQYLGRGGNLIDTSANYGDGASEQLAGKVLRDFEREKIIVVTKGGYIQGQNMRLAEERKFPEVVEYGPGIWHCVHPEFQETQIERSLARLDQPYADVYLLHNPEYFLEDIGHRRDLTHADHDEFYRRVREAFRYLESQVAAGRIRWYGVSSNNFPQPEFQGSPEPTAMTSVARCLEQARSIRPDHHFRVVQLPLNLYEQGGALEANNGGQTVLKFCAANGIGVLANRPLNAFVNNQLVRLADRGAPGAPVPKPDDLREKLIPLAKHEVKFRALFDGRVRLETGEPVSELLLRIVTVMQSFSQWQRIGPQRAIQPIQTWLHESRQARGDAPGWAQWEGEFVEIVNAALGEIRNYLNTREQAAADRIRAKLRNAGYPENDDSLSRMALRTLAGLEGMSCVLVGMRQPAYVADAMGIEEMEALDGLEILRSFDAAAPQFTG
jgi:hypothetical protein